MLDKALGHFLLSHMGSRKILFLKVFQGVPRANLACTILRAGVAVTREGPVDAFHCPMSAPAQQRPRVEAQKFARRLAASAMDDGLIARQGCSND